ncbi:MAG TPA: hypothetical protein VLW84_10320 [Terriglobales bacterium]|nr:hypothetical protein [Terriglobales bacterium]
MKITSLMLLTALALGCGYSRPMTTTQSGIMPVVAAIAPNSVAAGGPAVALTVNGSNFNANAVVNLNNLAQPTTRITGSQLMTTIPASMLTTPGMVMISVTNPGSSTPGGPYGGGTNISPETSMSVTLTIN